MFFKRQPKETPDELVNRLQKEDRVDQLGSELERYTPSKLNPKEKESFYHLRGIAAFQEGDRNRAFQLFKEGHEKCPESTDILFSLGQEYEARSQINEMFECFERCSFPAVSSDFTLAIARYAYLWDRPDLGSKYLEPIVEAYFQLGIVDDHFLHVRGLPFFSQTWSYFVAFCWMQKSYDPTDEFIKRSRSKLSDYNFDQINQFYDAHKNSDYTVYTAELSKYLKTQNNEFPPGYQQVQVAALKAVDNKDINSTIQMLKAVTLSENDFPWLRDILSIQIARSYWKAGSINDEVIERSKFIKSQQMLFEPEHAYAFSFLDYQEELKPIYKMANKTQ